jgi:hypothetical protein
VHPIDGIIEAREAPFGVAIEGILDGEPVLVSQLRVKLASVSQVI